MFKELIVQPFWMAVCKSWTLVQADYWKHLTSDMSIVVFLFLMSFLVLRGIPRGIPRGYT